MNSDEVFHDDDLMNIDLPPQSHPPLDTTQKGMKAISKYFAIPTKRRKSMFELIRETSIFFLEGLLAEN